MPDLRDSPTPPVDQPSDEEIVTRIEFFGDQVERIRLFDPLTGEVLDEPSRISIFPATV